MFSLLALILIASVSGDVRPPVLVLMFDGVHPSTVNPNDMPYLHGLRSIAAVPEYVKSTFPTKTFVTNFTVATGVGPNGHRVFGNTQYDGIGCSLFNHPEQSAEGVIPIWLENEIEDVNRYSGTMLWPGSHDLASDYNTNNFIVDDNNNDYRDHEDENDEIDQEEKNDKTKKKNESSIYERGKRAYYFKPYNKVKISWKKRADMIIEWLTNTEKKANLVMAHFEEYDHSDKSIREARQKNHIKKIEKLIRYIREQLKAKGLDDLVDMIIMSDHGTSVSGDKDILVWDDIIGAFEGDSIVSGPLVYIRPFKRDAERVYTLLKSRSEGGKKFQIFKKNELKDEWDMKNIPNLNKVITVLATPPYTFLKKHEIEFLVKIRKIKYENIELNSSGYDNKNSSMNAFFYGIGPTFKNNVYLDGEHFDLAAVYPLIRTLIGIKNKTPNDVQKNIHLDSVVIKLLENDKY